MVFQMHSRSIFNLDFSQKIGTGETFVLGHQLHGWAARHRQSETIGVVDYFGVKFTTRIVLPLVVFLDTQAYLGRP
tara:strand:+ start:323 stop:550 length:228 start_codon:yes stop_codon:yes gene_type:complete